MLKAESFFFAWATALMLPAMASALPLRHLRRRIFTLVPLAAAALWALAMFTAAARHDWWNVSGAAACMTAAWVVYELTVQQLTGRMGRLTGGTLQTVRQLRGERYQRAWLRRVAWGSPTVRGSALTLNELRDEYAATVLLDAQRDPTLDVLLDATAAGAAQWLQGKDGLVDIEWLSPRVRLAIYGNRVLTALTEGRGWQKTYRGYSVGILAVAGAVYGSLIGCRSSIDRNHPTVRGRIRHRRLLQLPGNGPLP